MKSLVPLEQINEHFEMYKLELQKQIKENNKSANHTLNVLNTIQHNINNLNYEKPNKVKQFFFKLFK